MYKQVDRGGATNLIDTSDLEWLKLNYPGVYYVAAKNILQGCLWFRMSYSVSVGKGLINPDEKTNFKDGHSIEDAYALTIEFDKLQLRTRVMEEGGRILRSKNKWKLTFADVHMYEDGSLCLCPEPEERILFSNGIKLRPFFYNILIPYFYYQSYLERFGKEPWRSSSHGELGILESYGNQLFSSPSFEHVNIYLKYLTTTTEKTILGNNPIMHDDLCLCNSGKKFSDCHVDAFDGYKKLFSDFTSLKPKKRSRQN